MTEPDHAGVASRRQQALAAAGIPLLAPEENADTPAPSAAVAVVLPDDNAAWETGGDRVDGTYTASYLKRVLERQIRDNGNVDGDMLDQVILDMRVSGMSHAEIARKLPPMTAEEVQLRLRPLLLRAEQITSAEGRALQIIRLEKFVNMLWGFVAGGSVNHADTMVKVLERLGKTLDLESERSTVTLDYVSKGQIEMFEAAVNVVVNAITAFYDRKFAEAGYEPIPHEVIEGLVAEVLLESSAVINDAHDNPIMLEKGRNGVLQPVRAPDKL